LWPLRARQQRDPDRAPQAARRTLEEVLSPRQVLHAALHGYVRERVAVTGIEVMELAAKANLIRRREEPRRRARSSTPRGGLRRTFLRLKELESMRTALLDQTRARSRLFTQRGETTRAPHINTKARACARAFDW
jgi:hypothetical protein